MYSQKFNPDVAIFVDKYTIVVDGFHKVWIKTDMSYRNQALYYCLKDGWGSNDLYTLVEIEEEFPPVYSIKEIRRDERLNIYRRDEQ